MSKTMQQKAADAHNMCKLKGDSMLDNSDRQIAFEAVYDSEEIAVQAVEFFTQKAKSVETEPCDIQSEIIPIIDGFLMKMWITFSCQAEVILFQMAVR
ncbi:YfcZ/YiiS family protein [Mannheimia haemolytica]